MRYFLMGMVLLFIPMLAVSKGEKIKKIVIDPGHGGRDGGATGSFSHEKDIALAVSLRVGKMIQDSLKDVQVIYTRTTDIYPSLVERHEIANKSNADIFISI